MKERESSKGDKKESRKANEADPDGGRVDREEPPRQDRPIPGPGEPGLDLQVKREIKEVPKVLGEEEKYKAAPQPVKSENTECLKELETSKRSIEQLEGQVLTIQNEKKKLEEEKTALQSQLDDSKAELRTVRTDLETKTQDLASERRKTLKAEEELEQEKEKAKKAERDLQNEKTKRDEAEKREREISTTSEQSESLLQAEKKTTEKQMKEIDTLRIRNKQLETYLLATIISVVFISVVFYFLWRSKEPLSVPQGRVGRFV